MDESLEETFDKYAQGKVEAKEKKYSMLLKSGVTSIRAKLIKKQYDELVKAGFKREDALAILISGVISF
jgi:hypothetical protein